MTQRQATPHNAARRHLLASGRPFVASRYLTATWEREAKPKYLKALDFVAGLIRKFNSLGLQVSMDIKNDILLRRVIQMRKIVQQGFDPILFAETQDLVGRAGGRILKEIERKDQEIHDNLPDAASQRAFFQKFPDTSDQARHRQAAICRDIIRRALRVDLSDKDLDQLVQEDRDFYNRAFDAVGPRAVAAQRQSASVLSGAPGKFQSRTKASQSAWDKSTKKKRIPFYLLGDLVGCRSIVKAVPDLCNTTLVAQANLNVVEKDNRYLSLGDGYNAVHYAFIVNGVVVEYQIKTKGNFLETGISHDLLHSDLKFKARFPQVDALSPGDKELVRMVIDISSQLASRDWAEYLKDPASAEIGVSEGADLLYEGDTRMASQVRGLARLIMMGLIPPM